MGVLLSGGQCSGSPRLTREALAEGDIEYSPGLSARPPSSSPGSASLLTRPSQHGFRPRGMMPGRISLTSGPPGRALTSKKMSSVVSPTSRVHKKTSITLRFKPSGIFTQARWYVQASKSSQHKPPPIFSTIRPPTYPPRTHYTPLASIFNALPARIKPA